MGVHIGVSCVYKLACPTCHAIMTTWLLCSIIQIFGVRSGDLESLDLEGSGMRTRWKCYSRASIMLSKSSTTTKNIYIHENC